MNNPLVKIFRVLLISSFLISYLFSQSTKVKGVVIAETETSVILNPDLEKNISIKRENEINQSSELFMFDLYSGKKQSVDLPLSSNIVSSFRNNIRFGGFWDKYTIINLTPSLNIKPADFISFYAFQNLSYFVPIDGIKQNFKSMAFRGFALMLIDYTEKILFKGKNILVPIISFAAKVMFVSLVNNTERNNDERNNLHHYDYHYYSVSIRF